MSDIHTFTITEGTIARARAKWMKRFEDKVLSCHRCGKNLKIGDEVLSRMFGNPHSWLHTLYWHKDCRNFTDMDSRPKHPN